jgi:hypothetical protein
MKTQLIVSNAFNQLTNAIATASSFFLLNAKRALKERGNKAQRKGEKVQKNAILSNFSLPEMLL